MASLTLSSRTIQPFVRTNPPNQLDQARSVAPHLCERQGLLSRLGRRRRFDFWTRRVAPRRLERRDRDRRQEQAGRIREEDQDGARTLEGPSRVDPRGQRSELDQEEGCARSSAVDGALAVSRFVFIACCIDCHSPRISDERQRLAAPDTMTLA